MNLRKASPVLVILLWGNSPGHPALAESLSPIVASQVGYSVTEVAGSFSYSLQCQGEPGMTEWVSAVGVRFTDNWFPTFVHASPHRSDQGALLQVGDTQVIFEAREEAVGQDVTEFAIFGQVSSTGGDVIDAHIAWGTWGGTAACTVKVNGSEIPSVELDGTHAVFVGPEAFRGGIYREDQGGQMAVGRIFEASFSEPSRVFGRLVLADADEYPPGQGFVITDDVYPIQPIADCGSVCPFGRPQASRVAVLAGAAFDDDGGDSQQLWLIDVPASAAD
jgi:hypothetical protein